jgi:rSAM/selenodomain-associated transferase 1
MPGRVKRRLAADIGTLAAAQFYRRCLRRVVQRVGHDPRWRTVLAVTPPQDIENARPWARLGAPGIPRVAQVGDDLGERMDHALASMPPGPAVLIGSDIPDIRAHHIAAAFHALGRHDVVFGPAVDGGYWLVGLARRRRVYGLFDDVRWSTEHALADTLANVPEKILVGFVATLADVDDGPAYRAWRHPAR